MALELLKATNGQTGFTFEGDTCKDVIEGIWKAVEENGSAYQSQRGPVKSMKGVTIIINNPNPENKDDNYPYWNEKDDTWYQDNFVRKETTEAPEVITPGRDIYPYKYAWRSRYYDGGIGHVKGVVELLQHHDHADKVGIKTEQELVEFIKATYKQYHPENILAVLSWQNSELLNQYLTNPKLLDQILESNRTDTLMNVITEIQENPASRRAITASFTYEPIDHSGVAGGVPVYQNYQLYTLFDKKGVPVGLESHHLHRAIDAYGGAQLDISHDRDWGNTASSIIGLPLKRMVIYVTDAWAAVNDDSGHKDLVAQTDIRKWLFAVTDGYDPEQEDIEKRLTSPIYQKKIALALSKLNQ